MIPMACGRTLELGRRTAVAGILNLTPDSFSDGGLFQGADAALRQVDAMLAAGADLIDVGGESTRPGAAEVPPELEAERVVPVILEIRRRFDCIVSVDTRKGEVARLALEAGGSLINDVSALGDPSMAGVAAAAAAPLILMHMRGDPSSMQHNTTYDDLIGEIRADLLKAVEKAALLGISDDKIILDPGIGFGKSREGNLEILRRLPELNVEGRPVMIGASRKAFIGATLDLPVDRRLTGSLAVAAVAAWQGAHILRVHDVAETVRVVRMVDAIRDPD
jgi:dihydropteroate synthase